MAGKASEVSDVFGEEPSRNAIDSDRILDAGLELLMTVGPHRVKIADVARNAKVSRATIYRRWSTTEELISEIVNREWMTMATLVVPDPESNLRVQLVDTVVGIAKVTRENQMWRKILETDPAFLLTYLLQRRGPSTDFQLQLIEFHIRRGIIERSIRKGEPGVMAQAMLAAATSFVLSGPVVGEDLDALDEELTRMLNRFLMP